jgi:hypothetical protein
MKTKIIALATSIFLFGCSDTNSHEPDKTIPSRPTDEETIDISTRFESPQLSIHYDNGGVIASSSTESGRIEYTLTDINSGDIVHFSATGNISNNTIVSPRLTINGATINISSAEALSINSTGAGIKLLTPDAVEMIFVMSD